MGLVGEIEDAMVHLEEARRQAAENVKNGDLRWFDVGAGLAMALSEMNKAWGVAVDMKGGPFSNPNLCPRCRQRSVEHGRCLWLGCGWTAREGGLVRTDYSTDFRPPEVTP